MRRCILLGTLLWGCACLAEQREFLTSGEITQVREAQEPDDRMKLYVSFAKVRLESLTKELAAAPSAKRGEAIHDLLEEYDKILDAMDDLAELAVTKHALMRKSLMIATKELPEFLKKLEALEAQNPQDLDHYRFIMRQTMETTQSTLESLRQHLAKTPPDRKLEKELEKEEKQQKRKDSKKSSVLDLGSRVAGR